MASLLNSDRPPVFCPGCAHERVVVALDKAFSALNLTGDKIALVSDIGCSGLFDTFFHTHALHGLHGRALTYAAGIKAARPELTVVVTMGDGGLGIGGAHLLSACRRNLDLTLLVLNNFNFGMTGGQCSSTTPQDAEVASGFLNRLEKPVDIGPVAAAAGAGKVCRVSTHDTDLVDQIRAAIEFNGFSLLDIRGICPGRYTKRNKLTPKAIREQIDRLPPLAPLTEANRRPEYGAAYREAAAQANPAPQPLRISPVHNAPGSGRREVVLLGGAGQRIITAGELMCLAGATAGLHATQKSDYPITVMRGHSISEMILDDAPIGFTGIDLPGLVIAVGREGTDRRKKMFSRLPASTYILKAADVSLPGTAAEIQEVDFASMKIKPPNRALAALSILAAQNRILSRYMLEEALKLRFTGKVLQSAMETVEKAAAGFA